MLTVLLKASETNNGGGAWSQVWPILLGAAAALMGSLIATLLSQRHQRQMAEDVRLEARRGPARALILNILSLAEQWTAAAESFAQLIWTKNPEGFAASLDNRIMLIEGHASSILDLSRQLSQVTAEAGLVFQEEPLLEPIATIQLAAKEPDADAAAASPPAYDYWAANSDVDIPERIISMVSAKNELSAAAERYLRTPLAGSPKKSWHWRPLT